jgi:hypothetical protein
VRALSLRELNRTTLLRQMLLAREQVAVTRAIERLAALQAQATRSPYLALWSRLAGFRHEDLTRGLRQGRVIKAWLMRTTLHLVTARDYPLYATTVRAERPSYARAADAPPAAALVRRARAFVEERPRTRRELLTFLEGERGAADDVRDARDLLWLSFLIPLEHAAETALWDFPGRPVLLRAHSFERPPLERAVAHTIRRFLAAFGPASRADLAQWTGVPLRVLDSGLDRMRLRRFAADDGRELLDLPRAPLAPADARAPVRLLPVWDELLLAHANRSRILPDEYRKTVIARNGDVAQTFLVDGFVAGTWALKGRRVTLTPFAPLPRTARRALEDEAARLAAFVG